MLTYKKSGIYSIKNLITGVRYIGSTSNLSGRKSAHFYSFRKGNHPNPYLQRSFSKHGEENFTFEILMYCEKSEITKYEQFYIDYYKPKKLYNIRKEAQNNSGLKHTEKTKNKISKTLLEKGINKGEKNGMYGKTGEKNPFYGKQHSLETRKKISENNKGKFTGKENPFYGKTHTESSKKNISLATRGEKKWSSKLKEEDVLEIRKLLLDGIKISDIAKKYNVSYSTICGIKNNRYWKHI